MVRLGLSYLKNKHIILFLNLPIVLTLSFLQPKLKINKQTKRHFKDSTSYFTLQWLHYSDFCPFSLKLLFLKVPLIWFLNLADSSLSWLTAFQSICECWSCLSFSLSLIISSDYSYFLHLFPKMSVLLRFCSSPFSLHSLGDIHDFNHNVSQIFFFLYFSFEYQVHITRGLLDISTRML